MSASGAVFALDAADLPRTWLTPLASVTVAAVPVAAGSATLVATAATPTPSLGLLTASSMRPVHEEPIGADPLDLPEKSIGADLVDVDDDHAGAPETADVGGLLDEGLPAEGLLSLAGHGASGDMDDADDADDAMATDDDGGGEEEEDDDVAAGAVASIKLTADPAKPPELVVGAGALPPADPTALPAAAATKAAETSGGSSGGSGVLSSFVPNLEDALREALEDALAPFPAGPATPTASSRGALASSVPVVTPPDRVAGAGSAVGPVSPPALSATRSPLSPLTAGSGLPTVVRRRLAPLMRRSSSRLDYSIVDAPWDMSTEAETSVRAFLSEAGYMRRWLESTVSVRVHPLLRAEARYVQLAL